VARDSLQITTPTLDRNLPTLLFTTTPYYLPSHNSPVHPTDPPPPPKAHSHPLPTVHSTCRNYIIISFSRHSKDTDATAHLTIMTAISPRESASSDAIRDRESALQGKFTDWNHQRKGRKRSVVQKRIEAALGHPLAPTTLEDLRSEIDEAVLGSTDMDINQWYGMLQAGNWYDVLQQLSPAPYEENATRDDTPPIYTDKYWETATEGWEAVLRKRFTGWEVDVSDDTEMEAVVWPCLMQRLLWALKYPSSRLLPNHKDTIRKRMETAD